MRTAQPRGRDLRHQQPGHGPRAQGEAHDVRQRANLHTPRQLLLEKVAQCVRYQGCRRPAPTHACLDLTCSAHVEDKKRGQAALQEARSVDVAPGRAAGNQCNHTISHNCYTSLEMTRGATSTTEGRQALQRPMNSMLSPMPPTESVYSRFTPRNHTPLRSKRVFSIIPKDPQERTSAMGPA